MKLIAIAETTRFAPPMIRRVAFIDHTQIGQFERNLDCDVHYLLMQKMKKNSNVFMLNCNTLMNGSFTNG